MSTPGALISYEGFNNVRYATMLSGNDVKTLRCSYDELYEPLTVRSHQKRRGSIQSQRRNANREKILLEKPAARFDLWCGMKALSVEAFLLKRFCSATLSLELKYLNFAVTFA